MTLGPAARCGSVSPQSEDLDDLHDGIRFFDRTQSPEIIGVVVIPAVVICTVHRYGTVLVTLVFDRVFLFTLTLNPIHMFRRILLPH